MTADQLQQRLLELRDEELPQAGSGETAARLCRLTQIGREDLTLAKLIEAHWDAVAILHEAGKTPAPDALYGVWASEIPGKALVLRRSGDQNPTSYLLSGSKMFCSGASLVDRALIIANAPEQLLLDIDLRNAASSLIIDDSPWKTEAFRLTHTATITFNDVPLSSHHVVGAPASYLERPGFWHGALGPAACWAGGAAGLLDAAMVSKRQDPHTRAHLAAMQANQWAMSSYLEQAGREIDQHPSDISAAQVRALTVRHLVEQACTDTLRRFARAYGPFPLAMDEEISRRYQELDLFLRQSHAERDLESLGTLLKSKSS